VKEGTALAAEPIRPKKKRKPSRQKNFADWFELQRKEQLGELWEPDNSLSPIRFNSALKFVTEQDARLITEIALLYLCDEKKRSKSPPCPLLYFVEDWVHYRDRAAENLREAG
jgi:hypothetical protein